MNAVTHKTRRDMMRQMAPYIAVAVFLTAVSVYTFFTVGLHQVVVDWGIVVLAGVLGWGLRRLWFSRGGGNPSA